MKNRIENTVAALDNARLKVVDTKDLFKIYNEIIITHRGELYRLRITSNDKLILTK